MKKIDFRDISLIVYFILLSILLIFSIFYIKNNLIVFSIFIISLGTLLFFIITIIISKKTTKKLGYGPIKINVVGVVYGRRGKGYDAFLWEEKYYKRENFNKIRKWEKEFVKIMKKHIFYYILVFSLMVIGIFIMFLFLIFRK